MDLSLFRPRPASMRFLDFIFLFCKINHKNVFTIVYILIQTIINKLVFKNKVKYLILDTLRCSAIVGASRLVYLGFYCCALWFFIQILLVNIYYSIRVAFGKNWRVNCLVGLFVFVHFPQSSSHHNELNCKLLQPEASQFTKKNLYIIVKVVHLRLAIITRNFDRFGVML
jgi:hypothetical protein